MLLLYLKLFHVFFIFVWIGSLLCLSRQLALLSKEAPDMRLKLGKSYKRSYCLVDLPSMVIAVGLGLTLLFLKDMNWKAPWLHMKLTFAFLLIISDFACGHQINKCAKNSLLGRGSINKILHLCVILFLIGTLFSIYILKQSML